MAQSSQDALVCVTPPYNDAVLKKILEEIRTEFGNLEVHSFTTQGFIPTKEELEGLVPHGRLRFFVRCIRKCTIYIVFVCAGASTPELKTFLSSSVIEFLSIPNFYVPYI